LPDTATLIPAMDSPFQRNSPASGQAGLQS
jgi:hypothetical protein